MRFGIVAMSLSPPPENQIQQREWPWPYIFFVVAVGLLVVALWFQAGQDYGNSRFAETYTKPITSAIMLNIIYPRELRFDPPKELGLPLTAWISHTAIVTPSLIYTVTLQGSGLLFTDVDGRPVPAQMSFDMDDSTSVPRTLFVRPIPLDRDMPLASIDIEVAASDRSPVNSMPPISQMAIETTLESWWRFAMARFLGDIALPLSLATAVVGAAFEYLRRQQERKAQIEDLKEKKERKERELSARIQEARELSDKDLPRGILRLLGLEKEAREQKWEGSLMRELSNLRLWIESQKSDQYEGRLIREAIEAACTSTVVRWDEVLNALDFFYGGELSNRFKTLRPIVATMIGQDTPSSEKIIQDALWIWDRYDEDAREIVVRTLDWVFIHIKDEASAEKADAIMFALIDSIKNNTKAARLMRDQRLKEIAPNLIPSGYTWPLLFDTPTSVREEDHVAYWLGLHRFNDNPFNASVKKLGLATQAGVLPQNTNEIIIAAKPTVIHGKTYDRLTTAVVLYNQCQQNSVGKIFPIWIPLPMAEVRADAFGQLDLLYTVAQIIGESWIRLLPHNPGALLGLSQLEQSVLAYWLYWVAGSQMTLRLRLYQGGMKSDAEGQMLLRRIEEEVNKFSRPIKPNRGTLVGWLNMRPPELEYTYLIAGCWNNNDQAGCDEQATRLLSMAHEVAQARVILKLFVQSSARQDLASIGIEELRWTDRQLLQMLADRMTASRGEQILFAD